MSEIAATRENSDKQHGLTRRAALLMGANVVATIMTIALPLVLVRVMSQWEYGLYKQAFQIMMTVHILLNLQVAVSVFYFMEREPHKKLQVSLNIMLFYALVGSIVFIVFQLWPGWVTLIFHGSDLVPHIPMIGFAIFWILISANLDGVPIALGDVRVASTFIVFSQFVKAVMMITAGLIFGSLRAVLVAAVIQGIMQTIFIVTYLRRRFGQFFAAIDWPLFKAQIGNALPFGVGGIAAIVQNDMHSYFVSHYFDSATFAVYSVGCFQLPLLAMLATSFASALNPELAKYKEAHNYQAIITLWMDVTRKLSMVFMPAFALMFVLRREFITLLFTANYEASVPIFAVNLFTVLLGIAIHLHILRLFDRLKYFRLQLYIALIPVTWGALYLGLRLGGLIGVAVAVVCVQTLDVAVTMFIIKRELDLSKRDLQHLKPLLRVVAATAVAALVTLAARIALARANLLVTFLICITIFSLTYLISVFAVRVLKEEELASIRKLLMKLYRNLSARLRVLSATEG